MRKTSIRIYLAVICCFLFADSYAQPVQGVKYLNTITALPTGNVALRDNYHYDVGTKEDAYCNGYLRFNVEQELNAYYGTNKNYRVELTIQEYSSDASETIGSAYTVTLSVRINPNNTDVYKDYDEYVILNCHRFRFKISKVWAWTCSPDPCEPTAGDLVTSGWNTLPASLNVIGGIEMERYNDFDPEDTPPIEVVYDNTGASPTYKHIVISDYFIDGAWAYDIEWTYSNNYDEGPAATLDLEDVEYWFHNNSTRIRVYEETPIEIPAIFDQGYVVVRVRGIGKELNVDDDLVDEIGEWSLLDHYDLMQFNKEDLDGVNTDYYVKIDPSVTPDIHEKLKNWMFQTSFAEEGKMKHVVTYYDGTLRSRQTVTQVPYQTDKEVMITETFYDHVGRAAVQSLPSPHHSSGPTTLVKEMKYYNNFNQVELAGPTNVKFDRKYFERDEGTACSPYILPFDDVSGVAHYYSANNLDQVGDFAFVPKADGYAYTLTEFTNDNTGRISRQTGLGPDHILGSGHETKYFYGVPEQEELDRVFGNNAGNSNHYQKNLVVDPNGQVSVSYLDMKGNVIATALAGTPPENLDALKSETTGTGTDLYEGMASELVINALGAPSEEYPFGSLNWLSEDGKSLTVNKTILVIEDNTEYEFVYELADIDYITECMHEQCYDCVYDLTLSLIDDCGTELFNEGDGIVITIGDMPLADGTETSTSCDDYEEDWTETHFLDIGSYQLVKTLTLNTEAMNIYAELYIDHLESLTQPEVDMNDNDIEDALEDIDEDEIYGEELDCFTPYSDFEAEAAANLNVAEICGDFDCAICSTIESVEDMVTYYPELETYEFDEATLEALYNQLVASCEELCGFNGIDWCETGYDMMLMDMRPGGQYGIYKNAATGEDDLTDPLSIFNLDNILQEREFSADDFHDWQHPFIYLESDPDAGGELEAGWNAGYYLNEDNTRAYVVLITGDEAVDPVLLDDGLFIINPDDGNKYTVPENLQNVNDFIREFNSHPEWARSLVVYHPEFYYYAYCSGIKNCVEDITVVDDPVTLEPMNTYQFDEFLLSFTTDADFDRLELLGMFDLDYGFETQLDLIINMDPLFADGDPDCPNNFAVDYDLSRDEFNTWLNEQHCEKTGGDEIFTIWQAIYMQYEYTDPTPGIITDCPEPSTDLVLDDLEALFLDGGAGVIERWTTFANLYISTKQQYIRSKMDAYATESFNDLPDHAYSYGNQCIGNDEYLLPMIFADIDDYFELLFGETHLCNLYRAPYLHDKTARFDDPMDALDLDADMDDDPAGAMAELAAEGDYAYWLSTGNGAISLDILNFLNGMILNGDFYDVDYTLAAMGPESPISADLYTQLLAHMAPVDRVISTEDDYTLAFHDYDVAMGVDDFLSLNIQNTGLYITWEDLADPLNEYIYVNFENMQKTTATTFTIELNVIDGDDVLQKIYINATTDLPISDQTSFAYTAPTCDNTAAANSLLTLMQHLLMIGHFFDTTPYELGADVIYDPFGDEMNTALEITISEYIGAGPYTWEWVEDPTRTYKLTGSVSYLYVTFYAHDPMEWYLYMEEGVDPAATYIDALEGITAPGLWGIGGVNIFVATINGIAGEYLTLGDIVWYNELSDRLEGFPVANCDFPIETPCRDEENYNLLDFQNFLSEMSQGDHLVDDDYIASGQVFLTPRLEKLIGEISGDETVTWNLTTNDDQHIVAEFVVGGTPTCTVELNLLADEEIIFEDIESFNNMHADVTYAAGDISYAFTIDAHIGANTYLVTGNSTCIPVESCSCGVIDDYCESNDTYDYDYDIDDEQVMMNINIHTYGSGSPNPDVVVTTSEGDSDDLDCHTTRTGWDGIDVIRNGIGYGYVYHGVYYYSFAPATEGDLDFPMWVVKHNDLTCAEDDGYIFYPLDGYCDELKIYDSLLMDSIWIENIATGRSLVVRINNINPTDPQPCSPTELNFPPAGDPYLCVDMIADMIQYEAELAYNAYLDGLKEQFKADYAAHCINSLMPEGETVNEEFTYTYTSSEYHYTLYYYDLGSNLAMTVPPVGVHFLNPTQVASIAAARATTTTADDLYPQHTFKTHYHYNSLNQLIFQETPDAGESNFWYDKLGRLVLSQNAKQNKGYTDDYEKYSYTKFDRLGRIVQVGEILAGPDEEDDVNFTANINNMSSYPDNIDEDRFSVTETFYNEAYDFVTSPFGTAEQENLRNRIAYVTIEEDYDADGDTYDYATHYSYDIHGNVKTLVQENPPLDDMANRFKKIVYDYDLISGNVNKVHYAPGKPDRFSHRYTYDAINRLTKVETTLDARTWETEATYLYHRHGPLARQEIGDLMVQGVDYAYTIHGWLKGVNAGALNQNKDMGNDGKPKTAGLNSNHRVGADAFGFLLDYYNGDYEQISATATSFIPDMGAVVMGTFVYYDYYDVNPCPDLFNGNIRAMSTALMNTSRARQDVLGKTYQYDQLNRLVNSYSFIKSNMHVNNASFTWVGISFDNNNRWGTNYKYDGNGNILTMKRSGNTGTAPVGGARQFDMDNMTYNYYTNSVSSKEGSNQLASVDDAITGSAYTDIDIDDQTSSTNYEYDEIGNLISDEKEYIDAIEWTVYGKIKSIDKASGHGPDLEFAYDPMGNRIMKKVIDGSTDTYTYYVRDAQGNVMATYEREDDDDIFVIEQDIYGSSRLGYVSVHVDVGPEALNPVAGSSYVRLLGKRRYELSNHLGNVLVVITDRRFQIQETAGGYTHTVKYYEPDVVSAQDYDPFGMILAGRTWTTNEYRYGFNGKENDDEVIGNGNQQDYGFRIYNSRLGRFLSVDPLTAQYPWYTPYQFAGNMPIWAIDLDGAEPDVVTETAESYTGTPYEFGGKDPAFVGGLPEGMTEEYYLTYIGNPSSENGSRYNNPNYTNSVNINKYLSPGTTSCGIDCSGLAGTAFNSDEDKLMPDFDLYSQNAEAMKDAFVTAEGNNTGYLSEATDNGFRNLREGDLVFNANTNGTATHVMVATGNKRYDDNGNVTEIEVIQAPQTGEYVETVWRPVGENWSYGHTARDTDYIEVQGSNGPTYMSQEEYNITFGGY